MATLPSLHRTRPRGCRHCVECKGLDLHQAARRPYEHLQMWPAGLASPAIYYQLRDRQLDFQIKAVQREGAAAWRSASVAGARTCALLQRRGLPALSVKLPLTASGVNAAESAQYVRTLELRGRPPMKQQPAQAVSPLAALQLPLATPPPQQPSKRSRLAEVPQPLVPQPGRTVQRRSEAAHLVARSCASASSVGSVVIQLPPPSCRSSSLSGSTTPASGSSGRGSPLWWLHRFSAGVRSLVGSPMSISA